MPLAGTPMHFIAALRPLSTPPIWAVMRMKSPMKTDFIEVTFGMKRVEECGKAGVVGQCRTSMGVI